MPAAGVGPEFVDGLVDARPQAERGVLRQVVGQQRGLVEKQRQEIFDAGGGDALRHILVDLAARRVALETLAETLAEGGARGLVHRKLARRQEPHLRHFHDRALAVDVEAADRIDDVVEKVDAVGQRAAHRIEVDQPAAEAVFTGRDDLGHRVVAGECQLQPQRVGAELRALPEIEGVGGDVLHRREAVERGGHRNQRDIEVAARDLAQRRQPLRHQVLVRREMIPGQRLPVGQQVNAQLRREEGDLLQQPLRLPGVLRQHQQRTSAGRQRGQEGGVAGAMERSGAAALPGCGQLGRKHRKQLRKRALL